MRPDQQSKTFCSFFFFFYVKVKDYQNISKLRYWSLAFTTYKAFSNWKRSLALVFLPDFLHKFSRKIFLTLYFINSPNFIVWLLLLLEILGNICIVIICFPIYDVVNFENNLSFFSSDFPTRPKRLGLKFRNLKKENSFLREVQTIVTIVTRV